MAGRIVISREAHEVMLTADALGRRVYGKIPKPNIQKSP